MIPMPAQAERSERTKVFISYSRKDNLLADDLRLKLLKLDFEAYLDKHDILPGEPWQERLGSLIKAADSVVFLISPDSVASRTCDWEINETERLGKRLLPVVIREVDEGSVPGRLKRLNYIFMRETDNTPAAFDALQAALRTDIAWIREHTRLAELAHRWETERYPVRLLLRGTDIAIAEAWRDGRPGSAPRPSRLGSSPPTRLPTARRLRTPIIGSLSRGTRSRPRRCRRSRSTAGRSRPDPRWRSGTRTLRSARTPGHR